jgi:hypothetical protein
MKRRRCISLQLLLTFVLVACAISALAQRQPVNGRQLVRGHMLRTIVDQTAIPVGRASASERLNLAIGLPLRDRAGLETLLNELYDPNSPNYRQFLTVEEFTQRFGPTEADYQAVIDFARSSGLTVTDTPPNRLIVDVEGSVANIEQAFQITMGLYQHPAENRTFYAPMSEPTVPTGLQVLHISGLDNFAPPRPMSLRRVPLGQKVISNATGSGPGGDFIGNDFRNAYAPGVTLNGAGQTVGLFEFGPYNLSDVQAWFQQAGLPLNVPIRNILLDGVSGVCGSGCDDGEEVLDIDMAIAMAPSLTQVLVYEGNNAIDMFNRMATDNIAKQLSCSFGFLPPDPNETQVFMQFGAQGQNMFVASGDSGAFGPQNPIFAPADDAFIVSVGGTSLTTNGAGGPWKSEVAWPGSGGGISTNNIAFPSYQQGVINSANGGSTTLRNIPDVSSDADINIFFFANGSAGTVGGTSAAAPTWAGFLALANQQAAQNGKPPIGFLNPTIYAIGKGSNFTADFHDITVGSNPNHKNPPTTFNAVTGFDLVTGWGSPTGQNMLNALSGTVGGGADFKLSASPTSVTLTQGTSGSTTITVTPVNGFNGSVSLAASGLLSGVTASFNPPTTTSTSTLTLSASGTAATGTVTVTITGASGSLSHTATITLTVNPAGGGGPVPVNLSGAFNINSGIVTDGTTFTSGGFDNVGNSYSSNLLGPSASFGGTSMSFGPANAADAVANATVALPSGQFASLKVLAAGVNGNQASQTFTVHFSDGTTQSFTQSVSDWAHPQNFAGETIVATTAHRDKSDGTTQVRTVNVYGYAFTLNSSKTVSSITLPATRNVVVLAMTLIPGTGGGGTPAQANLSGAFGREGIVTDGTTFTDGGLDGGGSSYSANLLGSTVNFGGATFNLGAANTPNAVSSAAQTITLPSGQFSSLRMLATGVDGNQASQSFVVHFSDGTSSTFTQSISDWFTPQSFAGESTAVTMNHRNNSDGTADNRTFLLYGYSFSLNNSKTVSSITLPNNANVEVLAITLMP